MADLGEVVFRLRVCCGCNAVFSICRPCDRGQRYCSPECRVPALREQRRRANRRHQCSPEGRLDHRDRQREYRKRCAQKRVTDTPSSALTLPGSISACHPRSTETAIRIAYTASSLRYRWLANWRGLRCVVCGRSGRFVNPFPAYFQPVIEELLSNPPPTNYMEYLRLKLQQMTGSNKQLAKG